MKTAKNHDDVYVMEESTTGLWKVSHHNDAGIWRIAMTREGAASWSAEREQIDEWLRDPPNGGWSEGVSIIFVRRYLRPDSLPVKSDTVEVPLLRPYTAFCVRIIFEESESDRIIIPHSFPVGVVSRSNGGNVIVIAEPFIIDAEADARIEEFRTGARMHISPADDGSTERVIGVVLIGDRRMLIDMCIT